MVLLANSLLTGGIYVNDRTHIFEHDRPANPTVTVEVLYDFHETHVPLLFHYAAFQQPYRLTMSVFDTRKGFDRVEIDEIVLEQKGGETLRGMQEWHRELREDDWGLAFLGDVPVYHVHEILDLSIPKAEPCTLTLKGRLRTKSGVFIPLNRKIDYRVDRRSYVYPYWLVVYGRRLV